MNINGKHYRTIWIKERNPEVIQIINQQKLPHVFEIMDMLCLDDFIKAIKGMYVRGAGLIGATAGFGMYSASLKAPSTNDFDSFMKEAGKKLIATRPTAKNLEWAVQRQLESIAGQTTLAEKKKAVFNTALHIADEDADSCKAIGDHAVSLIEEIYNRKKGQPVHILTHCNAGWLAFVDYGSATSPIYTAFDKGIPVHVWVDETRPRNQGASLTAWELGNHGVDHTLIADNTGGHLMQHGMVDLVITGADRVTRAGDAANKIGTYLKALAAFDNTIPFYVALPSSTFDWEIDNGLQEIAIEERSADEVRYIQGLSGEELTNVLLCPENTKAKNYGFDVTPARLITGLITERGICRASKKDIARLYKEKVTP